MAKYKLVNDNETNITGTIHDKYKNVFIPLDEANSDYQEYLAWVAEGNEPEPADE